MTDKTTKPIILTSDLHADRWDSSRRRSFFEFVDFVKGRAAEFYILGDIFDFPALKGNGIWPQHKELITRLLSISRSGIPFTYLVGNHDLSLRGIEIAESNFIMTYSDDKHPLERSFHGHHAYMEHGHFHDPLFQDHIYDAIDFLRTVTGQAVDQHAVDFMKDVVRIFQRQPKHKQLPRHKKAEQEMGVPERFLKIWEQAAEQACKQKGYDIILYGHTHAPAILEMTGGRQWYVNTGDWAIHSTYVEITPAGIALKDWITKKTLRDVRFPAPSAGAKAASIK